MHAVIRFAAFGVVALLAFLGPVHADDWPAFRGPTGNGVSPEKDLPLKWTSDNFLWKVKLPGHGASSPITYGEMVFVTCYSGYGTSQAKGGAGGGKLGFDKGGFGKGASGKGGGEQKKLKLHVLAFDRQNGKELWHAQVSPKLPEATFTTMVGEHGYSTSTPATDGERVYAFFGKTGVIAFDLQGKQLWQADVGTQTHMHGYASSPILFNDLVIVCAAMESQSLVALDKKTGKEIWRARGLGTTWATPLLVETKDKKSEVVLNLPNVVKGFDPETGKELWRCQGIPISGDEAIFGGLGGKGDKGAKGGKGFPGGFGQGGSANAIQGTSTSPVAKDGIVYVAGGGPPGGPATVLAIKAGGRGDVTKTHLLWKQKNAAQFASPVISGDHLFWIDGTANCLRLDTGKVVYKERLYSSRGEYVSPVAVGDKIYALTRFDGVHVLDAGPKFKKLAHNEFAGDQSDFNSCPAVSNGRLYIRSNDFLYCIGKKTS